MLSISDQARIALVMMFAGRIFRVLAGCLLVLAGAQGGEKRILLRNETIVTPEPQRGGLRALALEEPASGLYLVQLEDHPPAGWRGQIEQAGAAILRPVPEDAFLVELHRVRLSAITRLPFVRWAGPYKPEHKTHPRLRELAEGAAGGTVRASALLTTTARGFEAVMVQRSFRVLSRYGKSPAGRVLEGEISPENLKKLAESPLVLWIEPAPKPKLFDAVAAEIIGGEGLNFRPLVHDLGFDGEGVTVSVADSGLHLGEGEEMHPDLEGRVEAFFYYGNLLDASDEHSHGTHVTGIIAGDGTGGETDENEYLYGLGIAPKARVVAQRIFDGLGGYEPPPSMAKLTTDAVRAGAEIGSNSWGDDTQGGYDISAMEFDALVRDADPETPGDQPYILEFSAGNAGPGDRTIGSPAVAKNVIATGASQNNRFDFFIYAEGQESMADFSSRGPCADGRIKPDVVAPGTWIASLQSAAATDENAWQPISPLYMYQGGTSQSGPQVSGAAAVFVQYYRETQNGATPSPALVKAALIDSAVDMENFDSELGGNTTFTPNMDEGWGRVDLTEIIGSDRGHDFTDQTMPLADGQAFEKRLVIASSEEPLKVTLAYTDVPGLPSASQALVNDLDLEVISPSGIIYRGNQFLDGESYPDSPGHDAINNVEGVRVFEPEAGEYIVRVVARKILADARADTGPVDQDFALVFSGDVPFPGQGVLSLDRRAYTVPAVVQLKLIDFDLAGQPSAQVLLTNLTQGSGLAVQLGAFGNAGVFTGAVATALMPAAADGRLHFGHDDALRAVYLDASPAQEVAAQARGDLRPPVISQVASTNRFGKETISWSTDELANSIVHFGTNGVFQAVTNSAQSLDHDVLVDRLTEGQTYQYFVVSADQAGNTATNDNNGAFFTFVAQPAATVLLVDAYTQTPDAELDSVEIGVEAYTVPLDRAGVSYEVWDVETEGSPKVEDLSPFRVVIWRINDSFWSADNTITSAQQTVITQYLEQGGSFLLCSMDILSRLGSTAFRTNVLQVSGFIQHASPFDECPDCQEDQGAEHAEGPVLEPLTAGFSATLDFSNYPIFELEPILPNIGPDLSDTFTPTTNAAPILLQEDGGVVGIRYPRTGQDTKGRVVFLSFPLDAVPLDGAAPNNRSALLRNLLSFLAPGLNGQGTISMDNTTYTVPSRAVIEVADSDLAGVQTFSVSCRAYPSDASVLVEMQPTVRPGLFRGFLTLVSTNEAAAPGRLPAAHGGLFYAEYLDQSANARLQAVAEIDTGIPEILNISVEPDYEVAIIEWETTEPTDALIQFGESTFLGKTAYDPALDFFHSLTLPALLPDRVYYYQVVSRDAAGNTVIDDNKGQLYTFRTLKPLTPPWIDDLEGAADEWSVQDGEDTESSWTLGTPDNTMDNQAFSPANAWGSNLKGDSTSYAQTFLVSPAIALAGGNQATLKFWHNYDFLNESTFELGRLLIFTNSQTVPITLANYEVASFGWEQEEFDLTPHLGKVVHLVWAYEMLDFSFENVPHPGWLVDDVEVTVATVARGTLQVTNNLAAAGFKVTGPEAFEGTGRWLAKTNILAGEYVITFSPVEYYQTPGPQTNTVSTNAAAVFTGQYALTDANQNGMADLWEREQFDEVSPDRTPSTDSDADGFTDLAEFVAGTDPKDSVSKLEMAPVEIQSNNRVKLAWPSAAGKSYQVLGSADGARWESYSGLIRATGTESSYTLPAPGGRSAQFFKVEVVP